MPVQPHNFPTLRDRGSPNHRPSVLLLGAGMSYGLVPGPASLLREKRAHAENRLGIVSVIRRDPPPSANNLYEWADEILRELIARNDPNPKLTLAHSLDIPYEDYWRAYALAQRSWPRHRVVARFAREGLWKQIWSLNWDCIQENAFVNVGLSRDGPDAGMPWPTVFRCFITAEQCGQMGESNTVKIIKPHGCAMALVDAEEKENNGDHPAALRLSDRFLITATELANLAPAPGTQDFVFAELGSKLCKLPLVVAGWSASENYLLDYIDSKVYPVLGARRLAEDELSVIDLVFNDQGHARLGGFYGKDSGKAHIKVEQAGFDLDQFFLWLQALYAMSCLLPWSSNDDQPAVGEIMAEIDQPPVDGSFLIQWVDSFLPVWVRLCWRCGLISCYRAGQLIPSEEINLESQDEHIPWILPIIQRPELVGAVRLLTALHRSGDARSWDFETFPGGLRKNELLVIPLPAWNSPPSNDLRGLKPLIDAVKNLGAGFITKVKILFLSHDPDEIIPDDRKKILKELVARDLAMVRFAKGTNIAEIGLEEL